MSLLLVVPTAKFAGTKRTRPEAYWRTIAFAKRAGYVRAQSDSSSEFRSQFARKSSRKSLNMADVSIRARENGPLLVTGPFTLVDHEGNAFELGSKETVALCRCGQSKNRPFCDGAHKACGFVAAEKAAPR
jgi:CDGSH-type Zn-finger protein